MRDGGDALRRAPQRRLLQALRRGQASLSDSRSGAEGTHYPDLHRDGQREARRTQAAASARREEEREEGRRDEEEGRRDEEEGTREVDSQPPATSYLIYCPP